MTPTQQQYDDAKRAAGNATLLVIQAGDFYELYHDGARTAARILGLNLVSRNGIARASFTRHDLDAHLRRLVHAGHRVAVCDQVKPDDARGHNVERVIVDNPDDPFRLVAADARTPECCTVCGDDLDPRFHGLCPVCEESLDEEDDL